MEIKTLPLVENCPTGQSKSVQSSGTPTLEADQQPNAGEIPAGTSTRASNVVVPEISQGLTSASLAVVISKESGEPLSCPSDLIASETLGQTGTAAGVTKVQAKDPETGKATPERAKELAPAAQPKGRPKKTTGKPGNLNPADEQPPVKVACTKGQSKEAPEEPGQSSVGAAENLAVSVRRAPKRRKSRKGWSKKSKTAQESEDKDYWFHNPQKKSLDMMARLACRETDLRYAGNTELSVEQRRTLDELHARGRWLHPCQLAGLSNQIGLSVDDIKSWFKKQGDDMDDPEDDEY